MNARAYTHTVLHCLRNRGWTVKGKCAWVRGPDATVVVDLQTSQYDEVVFVNVGVALHVLGHSEPPRPTECHLMFRIERLIDGASVGQPADSDQLSEQVRSWDPVLKKLGSLEALRQRYATGGLRHGLIRKEARAILAPTKDNAE